MKVFIIIPAYNEEKKIGQVILDLLKNSYKNIIVVDDGSTDNTYKICKNFDIVVLQHILNRGQGAALRTGTLFALEQGADYIVHFDADGQMQAKDIKRLLDVCHNYKFDVVLGSRFNNKKSIPILRRWLLLGARLFNMFFLGVNLQDPQSGFRVLTRDSALKLQIIYDRMAHCSQLLHDMYKYKLRVKEVPVEIKYTKYSLQKGQGFFDSFKIIRDMLVNKMFD